MERYPYLILDAPDEGTSGNGHAPPTNASGRQPRKPIASEANRYADIQQRFPNLRRRQPATPASSAGSVTVPGYLYGLPTGQP